MCDTKGDRKTKMMDVQQGGRQKNRMIVGIAHSTSANSKKMNQGRIYRDCMKTSDTKFTDTTVRDALKIITLGI